MILYEKCEYVVTNERVKVYISSDGSFLECYPDGSTIGWKKLLSGYYIKLSRDWVPGEVVHQCLQAPMQAKVVELEVDEQLVLRWHEYSVRKGLSELKKSEKRGSSGGPPFSRHYQANSKPNPRAFQARRDQQTAKKPTPIPLVPPSSFPHSQIQ